jgi:hypothetical protein
MSEFKTNKISPRKGTTTTIGDSGDSVSTSGGSTINNAGSISTAGITGGTINNTTGEIYLRGEVDWKPGDIKTASFTATDNQGFFVNTTSGEITVTLPASPSAGDVVGIKDYANTFDTNKCILNANGNKIQGSTTNFEITVEGSSIIIIYVDSTKGWVITDASKAADITEQALFITATGGTETTCGDFKIHTFTGPGTFCVSSVGNPVGSTQVDYMVVAGGGGGSFAGGGGGAGGFRESHSTPVSGCYTASPLATPTGITVSATGYPITIGGGGGGETFTAAGVGGNNSVFSTITSAGGGGGSVYTGLFGPLGGPGNGGSGGGGGGVCLTGSIAGGTGNTPPVSPSQGNPGGNGSTKPASSAGGGGGATETGPNAAGPKAGGRGGTGATTSISGSAIAYAGGGGAGGDNRTNNPQSPITAGAGSPCGTGGAGVAQGNGTPTSGNGNNGTVNRGGGAGAGGGGGPSFPVRTWTGGFGGSGIVIIRYKFQ